MSQENVAIGQLGFGPVHATGEPARKTLYDDSEMSKTA
jgi:hypothetical protein